MKRYERISFAEIPAADCSCGVTRRAFASSDGAPASVHLLEIGDEPVCHFHRRTTEIYVILEGEGHLELDGQMVAVGPHTAVMIKPGCRHRAVGNLKLFNISVPRFDPDDFFYDQGTTRDGELPVH
jgi:mannose-6-phosphate isomerase-like protein (cupin superfamily)